MHLIYNKYSGELMGSILLNPLLLQTYVEGLPSHLGLMENTGIFDGTMYYYDLVNTILLRPTITSEPNKLIMSANGVDSVILTGLPIPCTIKAGDDIFNLNDPEDNTFEFSINTAGVYTITIEQFPYITKSRKIEAI